MDYKNCPIGVLDSGIGGLTVVRELQRILPGEDIIYFGDSANCPYGNKSVHQIFHQSLNMLEFLHKQNVKVVAIACNTISTLVTQLSDYFDFKLIGIISPVADFVAGTGIKKIGLIATEFTVSNFYYDQLIQLRDPSIEVLGIGSPSLATLIDRGDFNQHEIDREIKTQVDKILLEGNVEHIILGCTHYPIVEENFRRYYPGINFINPAIEQANAVKRFLTEQDALSDNEKGKFTIYTSGAPHIYNNIVERLGINTGSIHTCYQQIFST